jgi:hypothetical protein
LGAWTVAGAIVACADTSNLSGGDTLPTDAAPPKPKDSGSTPIDGDGGPIVLPTGRCDPLKPFGAPTLVTELDPEATATKSAVLSLDELEVFYLRYTGAQAGVWDLRHARRATTDAAWEAPATDALTPGPQGFLSLTAAGKKLYFWTINQNYRSGRASTASAFGTPATYSSPTAPWTFVVEADDTAYFAKYAEGGTERFIHRAPFDSNGYNASQAVPNIHVTGASDSRAVLNASETALYFASNRPGGRGLDDVWVARRTSKQDELGPGTHVRELSTPDPDYVTWVSDDDCVVMLDRASHVYTARRAL